MKTTRLFAALAACCLLFASQASADFITYEISATVDGQLNGTDFVDTTVLFSAFADTDDIFTNSSGFGVLNIETMVDVDEIGSDILTNQTQTFFNTNNLRAGFGDITQSLALIFVQNDEFEGWDLTSSIGPISGTPSFNALSSFPTENGSFIIQSVSNASFTATLVVPEPSNTILLGLVVASVFKRRRRITMQ